MNELILQISSPYFCAGAIFNPATLLCIDAAPVIKYMIGKPYREISSYCRRKGWKMVVTEP